jgi:hypothetical protein
VPAGVTTVTATVPLPAGLVAVICVSETTVTALARVAPNPTDVAPVNPLPITVTVVPPPAPPLVGLIAVTTGAAAGLGTDAGPAVVAAGPGIVAAGWLGGTKYAANAPNAVVPRAMSPAGTLVFFCHERDDCSKAWARSAGPSAAGVQADLDAVTPGPKGHLGARGSRARTVAKRGDRIANRALHHLGRRGLIAGAVP